MREKEKKAVVDDSTVQTKSADFESEFRITELSRRKNRIVVESDDYFRPVIAVEAVEWESKKSRDDDTYDKQRDAYGCVLKISVHYNRKSVLFQVKLTDYVFLCTKAVLE